MRKTFLGCLIFLCCFPLGQAADFSIKISGGLKYSLFGDVNRGMNGYLDIWADGGASMGGDIINNKKPLHFGMNYSIDFIIRLNSFYSVGIGVGYVRARNISDINIQYPDERPDATASVERAAEAVPVRFSVFREFHLHRALNAYFVGGLEIYPARFQSSYWPAGPGDSHIQKAHSVGVGLLFGAGLEIKVLSRLAFIVEAAGNYAKISHLKGTRNSGGSTIPYEEKGTLYFYENTFFYPPDIQKTHALLMIHETKPTGEGVRMGRVDFSGFAVSGGIRIYF
jgi:hypothetical protein